jgi:hypothetical protein
MREDMSTAGPVHRVQSAAEVYGYPQGHIGHLTADEQIAFNDFKALLIEKGLYKPQGNNDEYGTHDDATLLYDIFLNSSSFADHTSRFLRARRFHVQDALKQFKDTEDWRKATQLDKLYETIDVGQYDETRKLVRHFKVLPALSGIATDGCFLAVPSMDRSSGSTGNSCLCLRGEAFELEDYGSVREIVHPYTFKSSSGRQDSCETPSIIRTLRKPYTICDAIMYNFSR